MQHCDRLTVMLDDANCVTLRAKVDRDDETWLIAIRQHARRGIIFCYMNVNGRLQEKLRDWRK
jgi:hypothetical protein